MVELQYRSDITKQVVEYLYTEIEHKHLGKGAGTNMGMREWVRKVVG